MRLKALSIIAIVWASYIASEAAFIKGKNVPRVGRSNEADDFGGASDHQMGYVIKTNPSKNIPRMGRRNYGMESRYDIPKLYEIPVEKTGSIEDDSEREQFFRQQLEALFEGQMEFEK